MELDRVTSEIKLVKECLKGASNEAIKVALWNRSNLLNRIAMKMKNGIPLTEEEKGAY